jgi:hypothetical protein
MTDPSTERATPWFREPMVWLLIAIPVVALAAGLITLILAYRGADPEVAPVEPATSQRSP